MSYNKTKTDPELGQRVHERGLSRRLLLVSQLLGQPRLGLLAGLFGPRLVDVVGPDGHVGENGHPFTGDLHEALAHGQEVIVTALADGDLPVGDLGHERYVHRKDAHLALESGQRDHVDLLGIDPGLRGDDFQFERGHAVQVRRVGMRGVGRTIGQSLISSMPPFM